MEQTGPGFGDVVVTDGLELQKVLDGARNDPTEATPLGDEEETDLQTARHGELSSDTQGDGSQKTGFGDVTSLADDGGRQAFEDGTTVESEEVSRNDERRLTSGSDKQSKKRLDIRTNRNHELKERLNIDSKRSKDHRPATRDSVAKAGQKKLIQSGEQGKTAQLESSIGGQSPSIIPESNLSASTPPPYILKVKNTPARAELDDIYFLCECFLLILFFKFPKIKLFT